MKTLFLILARGGSKGLPGKNTRELLGKPLIAYSIECAINSRYCSKVLVSTDDEDIATISRKYGADVPFLRPEELATDTSKSNEAILHAINFLQSKDDLYDLIVLLEPTSPLRDSDDIDNAIDKLLEEKSATSCVSITKSESAHPSFLFNVDEKLILNSYLEADNVIRRQELVPLFYPEGSFYIAYPDQIVNKHTFYVNGSTMGYELPKWKSFEIDTLEDFILVEAILIAKFDKKFTEVNLK